MVGVLHDDEFRAFQSAPDDGAVGHRDDRVAADDPQCLDLAALHRVEEFDRRRTGPGTERAGG